MSDLGNNSPFPPRATPHFCRLLSRKQSWKHTGARIPQENPPPRVLSHVPSVSCYMSHPSPVTYLPGVLSHVPPVSCHMSPPYPATGSHFVHSSFIFTHFVFHIGAVGLQFCLILPKKHPSAGQKQPRAPHETPKTPQRATQRPS